MARSRYPSDAAGLLETLRPHVTSPGWLKYAETPKESLCSASLVARKDLVRDLTKLNPSLSFSKNQMEEAFNVLQQENKFEELSTEALASHWVQSMTNRLKFLCRHVSQSRIKKPPPKWISLIDGPMATGSDEPDGGSGSTPPGAATGDDAAAASSSTPAGSAEGTAQPPVAPAEPAAPAPLADAPEAEQAEAKPKKLKKTADRKVPESRPHLWDAVHTKSGAKLHLQLRQDRQLLMVLMEDNKYLMNARVDPCGATPEEAHDNCLKLLRDIAEEYANDRLQKNELKPLKKQQMKQFEKPAAAKGVFKKPSAAVSKKPAAAAPLPVKKRPGGPPVAPAPKKVKGDKGKGLSGSKGAKPDEDEEDVCQEGEEEEEEDEDEESEESLSHTEGPPEGDMEVAIMKMYKDC